MFVFPLALSAVPLCFPCKPFPQRAAPALASLALTRAQRAEMAGELLQRREYFDLRRERLES